MPGVTPIFIFSLPRSGSTLLQRLIASHPDVATRPEPWLLLPILYATKPIGTYAEYRHELAAIAITEFSRSLADGPEGYDRALRNFTLDLYQQAADGKPLFLDKTPRYHLVAEDVMRLFPEAKVIFLWRNPLAIASSLITTWGEGRWNLFRHYIDLSVGLPGLVTVSQNSDEQKLSIRYEDLINDPRGARRRIFSHLGLDPTQASDCLPVIPGLMGDQKRAESFTITAKHSSDWANVYCNPLRRKWASDYLGRLGSERLGHMGYEAEELLSHLGDSDVRWSHLGGDIIRMAYGRIYRAFDGLIRQRNLVFTRGVLGPAFSVDRPEIG